jgi:hypothetical protein
MSRPLLLIPSPRSIETFYDAVDKLKNIDKLWMKYFPQNEAYDLGRNWFLNHPEYESLIILPDDLLVTQKSIDQLIEDSEFYNIISGYCNNTAGDTTNVDSDIAIGTLPPDPPLRGRYHEFRWNTLITLDHISKVGPEIIPVLHQGFALTLIKREIVQRIPFRTSAGCCVDSCLSLDLDRHNIPQFVDLRVKSEHIKTNPDILLVGKQEREMIFEPA